MTFPQTIQTALEVAACVAVLLGAFNEDKLIRWERKLFRRIKGVIKK